MAYRFALSIFNMSLSASIISVFILFLKYVLQKIGLKRSILMLLWLIIAIRLVCPALPETDFSFFNYGEEITRTEANLPREAKIKHINASAFKANHAAESFNSFNISVIASYVYILGVVACLGWGIVSYICLKRRLRYSVILKGNIYISELADTSFVLGFISPKIYIPQRVCGDDLRNILSHELQHIKRKDYILKAAAYIILSIHWFNPFIWFLFKLFCRDIEYSCDEAVIGELGYECRAFYLNTLLSEAKCYARLSTPSVCSFKSEARKRAENIAGLKNKSKLVSFVSLLVCVPLCFGLCTNARDNVISSSDGREKQLYRESKPFCESAPESAEREEITAASDKTYTKEHERESFNNEDVQSDDNNIEPYSYIACVGYDSRGYEHESYKNINTDIVENSIKNQDKSTDTYIKGSFSYDNNIEAVALQCGDDGEISIYIDSNSPCIMDLSLINHNDGGIVDSMTIHANGENIYSILGLDPKLCYDLKCSVKTGSEWKINGEYIIY